LSLYLALSHNSKPISQLWSKSAVKKPKVEKVLARADAMRPNIIFTMADDLGNADLRVCVRAKIATPKHIPAAGQARIPHIILHHAHVKQVKTGIKHPNSATPGLRRLRRTHGGQTVNTLCFLARRWRP
jgi:hypothetical protein